MTQTTPKNRVSEGTAATNGRSSEQKEARAGTKTKVR
jgi:hypothetical protein